MFAKFLKQNFWYFREHFAKISKYFTENSFRKNLKLIFVPTLDIHALLIINDVEENITINSTMEGPGFLTHPFALEE